MVLAVRASVGAMSRTYDDWDIAYAQRVATAHERLRIRRAQRDALRELLRCYAPSSHVGGIAIALDAATRAPRKAKRK